MLPRSAADLDTLNAAIGPKQTAEEIQASRRPARERKMLGYFGAVTAVTVTVLTIANHRPHAQAATETESGAPVVQLSSKQATANFPAADVTAIRAISQDTLDLVAKADQVGAKTRVADLETAWDDAQPKLEALDATAWTFLDSEIDHVLKSVRAATPDAASEKAALGALITSLTP